MIPHKPHVWVVIFLHTSLTSWQIYSLYCRCLIEKCQNNWNFHGHLLSSIFRKSVENSWFRLAVFILRHWGKFAVISTVNELKVWSIPPGQAKNGGFCRKITLMCLLAIIRHLNSRARCVLAHLKNKKNTDVYTRALGFMSYFSEKHNRCLYSSGVLWRTITVLPFVQFFQDCRESISHNHPEVKGK